MADALTIAQLQLLRLAEVGDVPLPRPERDPGYFADVELLVMLDLMVPNGNSFALTPAGAAYLERISRRPAS